MDGDSTRDCEIGFRWVDILVETTIENMALTTTLRDIEDRLVIGVISQFLQVKLLSAAVYRDQSL